MMTPEQLMRSRYEAFVNKDGEYLAQTTTQNVSMNMSSYEDIEWLKLDVIEAKDDEVEFKAYYREDNLMYVLHERSKFVKVDDVWKYENGILFNSIVQRNETCPCGSTKKFKKCCMSLK